MESKSRPAISGPWGAASAAEKLSALCPLPIALRAARLITVIESTIETRGNGLKNSQSARSVTQYFSKDGELLAEVDPVNERVLELIDEVDKARQELQSARDEIIRRNQVQNDVERTIGFPSKSIILITGPAGSGKTSLARALRVAIEATGRGRASIFDDISDVRAPSAAAIRNSQEHNRLVVLVAASQKLIPSGIKIDNHILLRSIKASLKIQAKRRRKRRKSQ